MITEVDYCPIGPVKPLPGCESGFLDQLWRAVGLAACMIGGDGSPNYAWAKAEIQSFEKWSGCKEGD